MNKSNLESFVINKHAHILFIANPYKKKPNKQQNLCHEFYKTRNETKQIYGPLLHGTGWENIFPLYGT